MRILSLLLLMMAVSVAPAAVSAQNTSNSFWKKMAANAVTLPESSYREFEPDAYVAYQLDYETIREYLSAAPLEFTKAGNDAPLHVSIPRADGTIENFGVVESRLINAQLLAKYPLLRSYTGYSLSNAAVKIKITVSPEWGFKGTIRTVEKSLEYVEPLAKGQNTYYMVYDRTAFPASLRRTDIHTSVYPKETTGQITAQKAIQTTLANEPGPSERGAAMPEQVKLKIYRFACAATGEFSQDHGGTTASVLAAMINYVQQLNIIYEADLNIRLILVDNVESILFLDPATDPYTGTTVQGWLSQNPSAMIATIGFNTYDIGHVFARYLGGDAAGVAQLGVCCTDFKGRGCSSANLPYGDYFLSVIGQEIGHQWDGGHTWTHCNETPGDAPGVACEPGSGSTIMSYAGTCGPDNVVGSSSLYYNICSIIEIKNWVANDLGNTCGTTEILPNHHPVVTIPYPNGMFLPVSTPFELTGSATDPDGDEVTYCWEESDTGPLTPLGSPQGSTPIFRSWPPTSSPSRTFPRIQTIAANQVVISELLPTYNRDLTFCLTARDNAPGGGGIGIDTVEFKVTTSAGPFKVTYPNNGLEIWHPGEYQYVKWDVANTNQSLVNCQKVNIRLSKNGGITYPITLASNVPNIGSACILVPDEIGSFMRIRVEAADHVFFDISNVNFKIQPAVNPGFAICLAAQQDQVCQPAVYTVNVGNSAWAGFAENVSYELQGLPAPATASFNNATAPAGEDVTLSIDFGATPEGSYDFLVIANGGSIIDTATLTLTIVSNDFAAFQLNAPANGSAGVTQSPTLEWTTVPDATRYEVQLGTSPSFAAGTIKYSSANITGGSQVINASLLKATLYYWRVRPLNECGAGEWAGPFVFATQVDACASYSANDLPKTISSSSTTPVETLINIPTGGAISDVNVKSLKMSHNAFNQLEVRLISPDNGNVLLFKNKCGFASLIMDAGFDDAASITSFPCPPNNGQVLKPQEALSGLNGGNSGGQWKLWIKDNEIGSGGVLTNIEIEVCSSLSPNPPIIVNNNTLALTPGTNSLVTTELLKAEDPDNTASELVFTVIGAPAFGLLNLEGYGTLNTGDHFTQQQVDNGLVRYFDYGFAAVQDAFRFAVTDGNGGLASGVFQINAIVPTVTPAAGFDFKMSPNPTSNLVRLDFGTGFTSDATIQLLDATGRQMRSVNINSGTPTLLLDVHGLPAGIYAVTVRQGQGVATRKLIVR